MPPPILGSKESSMPRSPPAHPANRPIVAGESGTPPPDDPRYEEAVREVFARAGIPVSGLGGPPHLRNLGGETVFHFLATRRKPAPAMALSAIYASPLMPWDQSEGNRLAMEIMGGEFDPDPPDGASPPAKRMMALIREKHETVKRVKDALSEFGSLMNSSGPLERHAQE